MKRSLGFALLTATPVLAQQEPAPRRLTAVPVHAGAQFLTVSGVRELKNGQLLVTDAKRPAIYLIDPKTGKATMLGSVGADSGQYVQPGGIYGGRGDTSLVLDRGQARVSVVSPSGELVGIRSIKQRGVQSSSDADIDFQRVDSRGFAYFAQRWMAFMARTTGHVAKDTASLVRFDPLRQHADTIALLRTRETRTLSIDEHMETHDEVIGSPEDTWGVAPDGRVVVVRAAPYRVEWYAPNGTVTRGPAIAHDAIPFTTAEKEQIDARKAAHGGVGVSSSAMGDAGSGAGRGTSPSAPLAPKTLFAPFKPPFEPNGEVIVSLEGHVWVPRNVAAGASKTIYDVFDGKGERVDRIELPARNRVVGFGPASIYTAERDERGAVSLRKYRL